MGKRTDSIESYESDMREFTPQNAASTPSGKRHRRESEPAEIVVATPVETSEVEIPIRMDDPDVKHVEIEYTRAEMADTLDALKEKLNPHRLMEEAKETAREATVGKAEHAFNGAVETVKDRALVAADVARGVGAMAAQQGKLAGEFVSEKAKVAGELVSEKAKEASEFVSEKAKMTVEKAKQNPVQTTLIGLGVLTGWLLIRAWQRHRNETKMEVWECTLVDD